MTRDERIGHWVHKTKFKKKVFTSYYEKKRNGQRIFNLVNANTEKTYESWQAAVLDGWKKVG